MGLDPFENSINTLNFKFVGYVKVKSTPFWFVKIRVIFELTRAVPCSHIL